MTTGGDDTRRRTAAAARVIAWRATTRRCSEALTTPRGCVDAVGGTSALSNPQPPSALAAAALSSAAAPVHHRPPSPCRPAPRRRTALARALLLVRPPQPQARCRCPAPSSTPAVPSLPPGQLLTLLRGGGGRENSLRFTLNASCSQRSWRSSACGCWGTVFAFVIEVELEREPPAPAARSESKSVASARDERSACKITHTHLRVWPDP